MPEYIQIDELLVGIVNKDTEEQSDGKALETSGPPIDADASGPSGCPVAPVGGAE